MPPPKGWRSWARKLPNYDDSLASRCDARSEMHPAWPPVSSVSPTRQRSRCTLAAAIMGCGPEPCSHTTRKLTSGNGQNTRTVTPCKGRNS